MLTSAVLLAASLTDGAASIASQRDLNGVLAIQAALISNHLKAIEFPSGHWLMEETGRDICSFERLFW
jgi:hypothetical protein